MRVTINPTFDMETGLLISHDGQYEYAGPVMLFDRSLNKAGKQAAGTATAVGSTEQGNASQIGGSLIPGLEREAQGGQGYTPTELAAMRTGAEQGAGGAISGITGQANLAAARTRNAGGFAGALDEAQREKGRQLSTESSNIEAKNAEQAQQNQRFAQGQLGGLYGTDTNAMLKAMGLVPEDINASTNANKAGWVQNFTDVMKSLQGAGASSKGGGGFTL